MKMSNSICVTVNVHPRVPEVSYNPQTMVTQCNMGCSCSLKHWDPVCAYNGMTYASPCLAGCQTSTGTGKDLVSEYNIYAKQGIHCFRYFKRLIYSSSYVFLIWNCRTLITTSSAKCWFTIIKSPN